MKSKAFRSAFPHTLPVMAGYLFLGMGFGILLKARIFFYLGFLYVHLYLCRLDAVCGDRPARKQVPA